MRAHDVTIFLGACSRTVQAKLKTPGMRKLEKADKTGMKSLSSWFTKKA